MTAKNVSNLAASVQARLQNHARATKRPFQELLQYYAMERFLYRLSTTPHRARFVLKGALMLHVWDAPLARATKDLDFLGRLDKRSGKRSGPHPPRLGSLAMRFVLAPSCWPRTPFSDTRTWVAQQLRNATPFGEGPEFIIRDRDSKFGTDFDRVARGVGTRVIKCPVRSPLVNATCERFLGSVRRECLDHIVILGIRHLQATLGAYVAYFNASRPHQGLKQRIPVGSATFDARAAGAVRAIPILGGLHHDCRRAA